MPIDMQKLMQSKDNIMSVIESKGPSLPVQIARETNISMLFASAYLSELYNERKVKMSNMKVGSSPLYYKAGQEALLENFIQHLNHKEKEAFSILKNEKILDDEKLEPAIRVAIRAIKDFAVPIRIRVGETSKLFWKYFLINDEEVRTIAQGMFASKKSREEADKQEKLIEQPKEVVSEKEIQINEKKLDQVKQNIEQISAELKKEKTKKDKKKNEESKFGLKVKEHIAKKNFELMEIKEEKKNLFSAKIKMQGPFGAQELYLVAKDKKKISEEDLIISLQKAQEEKMPLIVLGPGEIDKKALDFANTWRNFIKYEKMA